MNHDPLDTCPYDPVHRIYRSRMQFHLTKCSKNHPCAKKMCCPYDARHIVDEVAYKYHVDTCPGGESVWHYHITNQPVEDQSRILPIQPFSAQSTENWDGEDWDKDGAVKTYNPLLNIQDREVTRMIIGLPKAQRKAHRLEERRRFAELENQRERSEKARQQADSNVKNKNVGKGKERNKSNVNDACNQEEQEYKPLRRPKKQPQDILNASRASAIDTSIASINEDFSLQSSTIAYLQKLSHNDNSDSVTSPKNVPVSYSAILNRRPKGSKNNGNMSNKQNSTQEGEKENIFKNNASNNDTANSSVIEKLSSTLNEIFVRDVGHKNKSEQLNKVIDMAKKMSSTNKVKKLPRCAAKFPNLK